MSIFRWLINDGAQDRMLMATALLDKHFKNLHTLEYNKVLKELHGHNKFIKSLFLSKVRHFNGKIDFSETGHIGGRLYYECMNGFNKKLNYK